MKPVHTCKGNELFYQILSLTTFLEQPISIQKLTVQYFNGHDSQTERNDGKNIAICSTQLSSLYKWGFTQDLGCDFLQKFQIMN